MGVFDVPTQPTTSCEVPGEPTEPIFHGDYSFNTGRVHQLQLIDYIIFSLSLGVSTLIGVYVAWISRQGMSVDEFLLAGKNMGEIQAAASIAATFMSGISLLGDSSDVYTFSAISVWTGVAAAAAIATAAVTFVPTFYQLNVITVNHYLELRFNRSIRVLGACSVIIMQVVYMGLVLYAPSLSLSSVAGYELWGSIIAVGALCTFYTAFGGVKTVLYTDAFQAVMMVLGLLTVVYNASGTVGTLSDVWHSASRSNRLVLDDFRLDPRLPRTVWTLLIGNFFTTLLLFGVNQVQIHRILCCRSLQAAKRAAWQSLFWISVIFYLLILIGLYMAAFYEKCDPRRTKLIEKNDQILPLFVMDTMHDSVGLPGIFLSALLSATLSTFSSGLNSISTVIIEDFIRLNSAIDIKPRLTRCLMQIITFIFGVICLEMSYLASKTKRIMEVSMFILSSLASPVMGAFFLGMFFPWANERGALWGILGSALFTFVLLLNAEQVQSPASELAQTCVSNCNVTAFNVSKYTWFMDDIAMPASGDSDNKSLLFSLSFLLYCPLCATLAVAIGLIVSYFTGFNDPKTLDPRLIVPVFDLVFPLYYLPEGIREKLRFGINHEDKWNPSHVQRFSKRLISSNSNDSRTQESVANSAQETHPQLHTRRANKDWGQNAKSRSNGQNSFTGGPRETAI